VSHSTRHIVASLIGLFSLVGLAGTAHAQAAPLELRVGYVISHVTQRDAERGGFPVGFGVQVSRDWKDTRWGKLALVGQVEFLKGKLFDEEDDRILTFMAGGRITREPMASGLRPFVEFLLGYSNLHINFDNGVFEESESGGGAQLAGGVVMGETPDGKRAFVVRAAIGAFSASSAGFGTQEVGVYVRFRLGQ
jgi:hypothetical protein